MSCKLSPGFFIYLLVKKLFNFFLVADSCQAGFCSDLIIHTWCTKRGKVLVFLQDEEKVLDFFIRTDLNIFFRTVHFFVSIKACTLNDLWEFSRGSVTRLINISKKSRPKVQRVLSVSEGELGNAALKISEKVLVILLLASFTSQTLSGRARISRNEGELPSNLWF